MKNNINSSDGESVNLTQLNLTQSSTTANNNNVLHSTNKEEVFTTNPFDGDTVNGGAQQVGGGGAGGVDTKGTFLLHIFSSAFSIFDFIFGSVVKAHTCYIYNSPSFSRQQTHHVYYTQIIIIIL